MTTEIRVPPEGGGRRIDTFLSGTLEDMSRSAVQKAIGSGHITFSDGAPVKKNHTVSPGERFLVALPEPEPIEAVPQAIPLDIVFEDEAVVVVNKPRGMVVHPAAGHPDGTLVNALLHHCGGSLSGVGGAVRPGIVHRIDMDTSGLIIAAKNDMAHGSLSDQLRDRSLSRVYEAVAVGRFGQDGGTVDVPIGRHPADRKRMSTAARVSRPAVTHYQVLTRYSAHSHIRCRLETGRTHQIRVHMAHIGHPILGDLVYGRGRPEKGLSGQCLHARSLSFVHPVSGERITLTTELPDYFLQVLARLGPPDGVG